MYSKTLGMGQLCKGFGDRIHAVRRYAEQSCERDPNMILLCIDAYDVVLTGNLDELDTIFEECEYAAESGESGVTHRPTHIALIMQWMWNGTAFGHFPDCNVC
jgi:hypothetical protein